MAQLDQSGIGPVDRSWLCMKRGSEVTATEERRKEAEEGVILIRTDNDTVRVSTRILYLFRTLPSHLSVHVQVRRPPVLQ